MRELKCALNLPTVIGQTPQSRNRGDRTVRFPRCYSRKPGIAGFIGRQIFNRSFRNDVNARVIPCCGLMG
jgi:hypothetical protein